MGFTINPLTGSFDKVKIPLKDNTTEPTLTVNGDIQLYNSTIEKTLNTGTPTGLLLALTRADDLTITSAGNGFIYFRSQGITYKLQGTAV